MSAPVETLAAYFALMNMNGVAHVYREAVRAGLLDALKGGPQPAAALAARCGTAERPTALLLEVLGALGVVAPAVEAYALTPLARSLLDGEYRTLGDPYWNHLPAFLATGDPLVEMDDPALSESHYRRQAAALAWMLAPAAEAAAGAVGVGTALRGLEILDVGGGSGIWSLTMARHDPESRVTVLDWPGVLEVARDTADRLGLADRLATIAGNYHEVELPPAAFDLVLLGNVTHLETPPALRALFARLRPSLRSGGRLVVFDIFPGQPAGDLNRTLYALGLALRTAHGRVHTPEELTGLLTQTGFGAIRLTPLPVPPFAIGMLVAEGSSS